MTKKCPVCGKPYKIHHFVPNRTWYECTNVKCPEAKKIKNENEVK